MLELWIILFPVIGIVINGLFGRKFIRKKAHIVSVGAVLLSLLLSLIVFFKVCSGYRADIIYYNWVIAENIVIPFGILIDPLSAIMLIVVTFVGSMIHIYSIGYMAHDEGYHRFFTYFSIFITSMLILVLGNNFFMLFVGWELVGLSSYLLIGFWFERESASFAAKKAFITNRIGDFGFYVGVLLVIFTFKSLTYDNVFNSELILEAKNTIFNIFGFNVNLLELMTLGLFCGAIGKSAQFPLHVWLPDAMEGPTPVSALIHAATMVTAGVYMVARCNPLFSEAVMTSNVIVFVGALTALIGATIGITQFDLKRILAYSTVSQLGYMIMATGTGAYIAGIFHLFTHAFFKALLFLCSGAVMHAMQDNLDIRLMGGLKKKLPITFWTYLIGCLAISGIPPFAGFFSKDEILAQTFASGHIFAWFIGVIVAFMTAFYMFRSFYVVFLGEPRDKHLYDHAHEAPKTMTFALIVLAFMSVIAGGLVGIPLEHGFIHSFLAPVLIPEHLHIPHLVEGVSISLMVISIILALAGLSLATLLYVYRRDLPDKIAKAFRPIYKFVFNKWYFDELYGALIVRPIVYLSEAIWFAFDIHVIDFIVNACGKTAMFFGNIFKYIQTGRIQSYIFTMVFATLLLIILFYAV
ncbi:MAG: NADH-quinone oxidoreductase subunit L [Deferribacterota bacterium]|nr:NADH-quinone oxidoreductase subunit L [Deferribacterota bacterium]